MDCHEGSSICWKYVGKDLYGLGSIKGSLYSFVGCFSSAVGPIPPLSYSVTCICVVSHSLLCPFFRSISRDISPVRLFALGLYAVLFLLIYC